MHIGLNLKSLYMLDELTSFDKKLRNEHNTHAVFTCHYLPRYE